MSDEPAPGPTVPTIEESWAELTTPIASLYDLRREVERAGGDPACMTIRDGKFIVEGDDEQVLGTFEDPSYGRLLLSMRSILNAWAAAEKRAILAESKVCGLEANRTHDRLLAMERVRRVLNDRKGFHVGDLDDETRADLLGAIVDAATDA